MKKTFQASTETIPKPIKKILKHFKSKEKFAFREFQQDKITNITKELPKNKASAFKDIPVKMMVNSRTFTMIL